MNTAFLLLAHAQHNQLASLIKSLAHPGNFFFVHIDAKANLELFKEAIAHEIPQAPVFYLTERETCYWGRYSLVAATLRLLRMAYNYQYVDFDHFVLLSGQDYPLKSAAYISSFLEQHKGYDFIEYSRLPTEKLRERQGALYRINRYHYFSDNEHKEFPPYSNKPILNPLFNGIANVFHSRIRKMPLGMKPYGGSQWWILCQETISKILNLIDRNPQVELFFKNTWIPDEIFFQTIVKHVVVDNSKIINNHKRVILWEKPNGKRFVLSPNILTEANWEQLKNTDALFARKFHEDESRRLIEKINQHNNHSKAGS